MVDMGSKSALASLGLDAAALRRTLDRLHTALHDEPPRPLIATGALVYDRRAIADSLRQILQRLGSLDLTAIRALSGVVKEFRTEGDATRLRELFGGLRHGWQDRVRRILGEARVPIVAKLLASPAPDLLRILGREDDENAHSDLIAWLLNPRNAPAIAPDALRQLAARLGGDSWAARLDLAASSDSISVRREVVVAREFSDGDDLARVDITVSGPGIFLAIENKVWSYEHDDQTQAYWNWMSPMRCLRGGLFLSPSGMSASCGEFKPISYLELVSCLVEGPSKRSISTSEEIVLASYLKTLARRIIQVQMRAVQELAGGAT